MRMIAYILLATGGLILSQPVFAAGAKTYQVTGTVVEVTTTKIVVQKGTERWELDVGPETKGSGGNFKAGEKVTITYRMSATRIEGPSRSTGTETSVMSPAKIGAQKKEGPAPAATP